MRLGETDSNSKSKGNDVRVAAKKALLKLLEPLAGFVIDVGLSTKDLQHILREAAVRSVASQQLKASYRISISGIAATTGIPRSQISRILKQRTNESSVATNRGERSTSRILAAWHEEPRFTNANGRPADLELYGRGHTFETLVRAHGGGIPTRAVLDELIRTRAVDILPSQRVRVKVGLTLHRGISPQLIRAFGDRATELLSTMLSDMRNPERPRFVVGISSSSVMSETLPILRREVSTKGAQFLAEIRENLMQEKRKVKRRPSTTVSVTVFYHESDAQTDARNPPTDNKNSPNNKRKNFRRKPR